MDPFLESLAKHGLDVSSAAEAAQVTGWLSTGNYALNWAVSGRFDRGWPLGHLVEIFGDYSTGKSFVVLRAIAEAQKAGGVALLDDTEGALNPDWAADQLEVDVNKLALRYSHTIKDHFDAVTAFVKAIEDVKVTAPSVLALDSLAMLTTEDELKKGLEKPSMTRAKEVRAMLRQLGKIIHDTPATYLIANHEIANIGGFFKDKTTPGGGGVKYLATVRVELRFPARIKRGEEIVGVLPTIFIEKNRLCSPWRQVKVAIPFHEPISPYSGLIPLLLDIGVLGESGRYLTVDGKKTSIYAQKTDFFKQDLAAIELMDAYPDLLDDPKVSQKEIVAAEERADNLQADNG